MSSNDPNEPQYADFTTMGGTPKTCQRCNKAGIETFFMHDVNPMNAGKSLCGSCRDHYTAKRYAVEHERATGERTQRMGQITPASIAASSRKAVKKAVGEAQRKGSSKASSRVLYVGHGSMAPPSVPGPGFAGVSQNVVMSQKPWPKRSLTKEKPGLRIFCAGDDLVKAPELPVFMKDLPVNPGHPDAHRVYSTMRNWFAHCAFNPNLELVVITVHLMYKKPGNRTQSCVENIFETISNIPVHIGADQLKTICYLTILPLFLRWSNGTTATLEIGEVVLRQKDWVEIVPVTGVEDVDVIAKQFFIPRGKNKTVQFHPGKGAELNLEISAEKYNTVNVLIDTARKPKGHPVNRRKCASPDTESEPDNAPDLFGTTASSVDTSDIESGQILKIQRKRLLSNTSIEAVAHPRPAPKWSAAARPTTPPPQASSSSKLREPGSPTMEDVRRALRAQTAPTKKMVKSVLNTKSRQCTFYPTALPSFKVLVLECCDSTFHAVSDCQGPITATLIYNPDAQSHFGAFKKASLAHTSCPIVGSWLNVCIKQCWYQSNTSTQRLVHDNATQVTKLSAELNCLRWATALQESVDNLVAMFITHNGAPPFEIPQMRFVRAALAILVNETHDTYMIEEVIDDAAEGQFVKYIGNSSAKPLKHLTGDGAYRAQFLAFSQHVQYIKTKGLAFIADYQGGKSLLTDPQIITGEDTGHVFLEGNLLSTHVLFPEEHDCNAFCKFFKLSPLPRNASSAAFPNSTPDTSYIPEKRQLAGNEQHDTQGPMPMQFSDVE